MASNVNKVPIGSPLLANSQTPSLNIQSCKNLEGGNLTDPAVLQRDQFSEDKRRGEKKEKRKKEKRKAYATHVMGYPIDGVGGRQESPYQCSLHQTMECGFYAKSK